jgi:GMP reductase
MAVSSGITDRDFANLVAVLAARPGIPFICLDVANGYSEGFVEFVRKVGANDSIKVNKANSVDVVA